MYERFKDVLCCFSCLVKKNSHTACQAAPSLRFHRFTVEHLLEANGKEMSGQFKGTNKTSTAWQSSTVILCSQRPLPLPPALSVQSCPLPEAEGLLSALSLGHQAAVVAAAPDLRVLGQRGGRGSRGRGRHRRPVGRGRGAPRPLTLVLVGPAVAPLDVVAAGGRLLLEVQDAVDGALQVLVEGVVWGAAARKAGVVHVRRV